MASLSLFTAPVRRKLKCARNSIEHEDTNFSTFLFPAFTDATLLIAVVTHTLGLGPYGALRRVNGLGLVMLRFHVTLGDAVTL